MTELEGRIAHCYRCIYTWRVRNRPPRLCARCKSRNWNVALIRPVHLGNGLGIGEVLGPHRAAVLRLARKYGALNVRVFGSVRRREADGKSDVDLLVDWGPRAGLFDLFRLRRELAALIDRTVDVFDEQSLNWSVKPQVLAEAVPL